MWVATGRKGGPARAAKLPGEVEQTEKTTPIDASDKALTSSLECLKAASGPDEIRQVSDEIERIVFHKQFANA